MEYSVPRNMAGTVAGPTIQQIELVITVGLKDQMLYISFIWPSFSSSILLRITSTGKSTNTKTVIQHEWLRQVLYTLSNNYRFALKQPPIFLSG